MLLESKNIEQFMAIADLPEPAAAMNLNKVILCTWEYREKDIEAHLYPSGRYSVRVHFIRDRKTIWIHGNLKDEPPSELGCISR
jgi:hypothetical protein